MVETVTCTQVVFRLFWSGWPGRLRQQVRRLAASGGTPSRGNLLSKPRLRAGRRPLAHDAGRRPGRRTSTWRRLAHSGAHSVHRHSSRRRPSRRRTGSSASRRTSTRRRCRSTFPATTASRTGRRLRPASTCSSSSSFSPRTRATGARRTRRSAIFSPAPRAEPFRIDNAKFIFIDKSEPATGQWVHFGRNVREDFQSVWGTCRRI